jgi:hypothetical protein
VFSGRGRACVELDFDREVWAELRLEGVDLDATGKQRTANARVFVDLLAPRRSGRDLVWRFDFVDAAAQLERAARRKWWWGFRVTEALSELSLARDRLLENEQGREPLLETEGLTAAGQAATKMSTRMEALFLGDLSVDETSATEPRPVEGEP